jgi:hypothetical protein
VTDRQNDRETLRDRESSSAQTSSPKMGTVRELLFGFRCLPLRTRPLRQRGVLLPDPAGVFEPSRFSASSNVLLAFAFVRPSFCLIAFTSVYLVTLISFYRFVTSFCLVASVSHLDSVLPPSGRHFVSSFCLVAFTSVYLVTLISFCRILPSSGCRFTYFVSSYLIVLYSFLPASGRRFVLSLCLRFDCIVIPVSPVAFPSDYMSRPTRGGEGRGGTYGTRTCLEGGGG